jgi:hypothetical protein
VHCPAGFFYFRPQGPARAHSRHAKTWGTKLELRTPDVVTRHTPVIPRIKLGIWTTGEPKTLSNAPKQSAYGDKNEMYVAFKGAGQAQTAPS